MQIRGTDTGKHAKPDEMLAKIKAALPDTRSGTPRIVQSSRFRAPIWAAAVAVFLILAAALLWLTFPEPPEPPAVRAADLVNGALKGLHKGSDSIDLASIVSTEDETAGILCRDGSRLELEAESTIRILGPVDSDRWRVELLAGAIQCTVPKAQRPFRLTTRAADIITESTQFSVRVAAIKTGQRGIVVRVTEGTVRVEQQQQPTVRMSADETRIVPEPGNSKEDALLTFLLLFPEELIEDVETELKNGLFEIEGKIVDGEVEALIAPDGMVESYAIEVSGGRLPGEIPDHIRRTIETTFGKEIKWLEAETKFEKGSKSYEVEIRSKGKEIEVELDAYGNIIRREED